MKRNRLNQATAVPNSQVSHLNQNLYPILLKLVPAKKFLLRVFSVENVTLASVAIALTQTWAQAAAERAGRKAGISGCRAGVITQISEA